MSAFFIVASLILLIMQVCIGLWLYFAFPAIGWKIPAAAAPLVLTVFFRWAMTYTRTHYGTLESIIYYAAYMWAGFVFIFFSLIIIFALLQALCALCHIPARHILGPVSVAVMLAAAGLSIWGGFAAPKVKHIYVTIPGAPKLTAALLSDSHLGVGVSLARFESALKRMQAEKPDILLVLGDVYEYGMHPKKYAQALANFKTKYGTYGVLGNHEYYMGYQNSLNFYEQANITLLQNQVKDLPDGWQLIGLSDIKMARVTAEKVDKLLAQTDPQKYRLLLSHQPLLTETVAAHQIPLMMSGHTHAGQIWPFNYFVKLRYPHAYGLYQTGPASQIYVTSGLFYWGMPLRLMAPAEIPILHIN